MYQKKLQKLLDGASEPAPISRNSAQQTTAADTDDVDFSADSEPEGNLHCQSKVIGRQGMYSCLKLNTVHKTFYMGSKYS